MSGRATGNHLLFFFLWTPLQRVIYWHLTTDKTQHMERAVALCNKDKQRTLERPDIMLQNCNRHK